MKSVRSVKTVVEIWFELIHCWNNPDDAGLDHPVWDRKGFFSTEKEAKEKGQKYGKYLSSKMYEAFNNGMGDGGYAVSPQHVLVWKNGGKVRRYLVELNEPFNKPAKQNRESMTITITKTGGGRYWHASNKNDSTKWEIAGSKDSAVERLIKRHPELKGAKIELRE